MEEIPPEKKEVFVPEYIELRRVSKEEVEEDRGVLFPDEDDFNYIRRFKPVEHPTCMKPKDDDPTEPTE
jgi:hypothetical protein